MRRTTVAPASPFPFRPGTVALVCCLAAVAGTAWAGSVLGKELGSPRPVEAKHWDAPFAPGTCSIVGAYMTLTQQATNRYSAFVNTFGTLDDGLEMWIGTAPTGTFISAGVVLPNRDIDDLPGEDGQPHPKRCITRPFIDWHPEHGFVGIVHVCRNYMPTDNRVYPALVRSATGGPGTWTYHGRLKGEIWDGFGDGKGHVHSDGGGFFFRPDQPNALNREQPLENRYVFFTSHYSGWGHVNLLYSADGEAWFFHRDANGRIVNLAPAEAGKGMIFPSVVRTGNGWQMALAEQWPPVAIWRLRSVDGLAWSLAGEQPEIGDQTDLFVKNLSLWYEQTTGLLHGYLTVRSSRIDGSVQSGKYHSARQTGWGAHLNRR